MGDSIKITHTQGNVLLNGSMAGKFPKEVGGRAFNDQAQAKINDKFRLLFKKLKKISSKSDGSYLFGKKDNWKQIEVPKPQTMTASGSVEMQKVQTETQWSLVDADLEIELADLTGAEKSGIYWLCYLWCHPASPNCQNPGVQEDVIWPVIEKIGKTADLRKDIGLVSDGDEEYFGESKPAEKKAEAAPAV